MGLVLELNNVGFRLSYDDCGHGFGSTPRSFPHVLVIDCTLTGSPWTVAVKNIPCDELVAMFDALFVRCLFQALRDDPA